MPNVTITMDEDTARWVRIEAAKAGKSVSRWVGEALAERRHAAEDAEWEAGREARLEAGRRFLASESRDLGYYGRAPAKDELYDEVLRRHERAGVQDGSHGAYEAGPGNGVAVGDDGEPHPRAKRTKPA